MSGTYDCDNSNNDPLSQNDAFFATGQSSSGLQWCGPDGVSFLLVLSVED